MADPDVPDASFLPIDPRDLMAGDHVTVVGDSGVDYAVVKILAVDAEGVHIRLYQERFATRPTQVDATRLTLGPVIPVEGVPLSVGHAPFSHDTFAKWGAVLLSRGATVAESELAGYRGWQEAEGGYF